VLLGKEERVGVVFLKEKRMEKRVDTRRYATKAYTAPGKAELMPNQSPVVNTKYSAYTALSDSQAHAAGFLSINSV
jgi:hypothetical protein